MLVHQFVPGMDWESSYSQVPTNFFKNVFKTFKVKLSNFQNHETHFRSHFETLWKWKNIIFNVIFYEFLVDYALCYEEENEQT